jgi:hypothetical protein
VHATPVGPEAAAMILGLFRSSPEREARRLRKDAEAILDMARHTYRESVLEAIARATRQGIAQVAQLAGDDETRVQRELDRIKTLHREARRRHDQTGLTAFTLVIIHTRAGRLGEAGEPARAAIEAFLDEWPAGDDSQPGTLAG